MWRSWGQKLANPHHLARYPLADLFLDTVPYGAHTTASDAMWMGVPVLTYSGKCFASRVCGSLIRSAGLPEMVCETPEAFVARAIALAGSDRLSLRAYRERLIANRDTCTLFDIHLLARKLEGLYAQMADEHRRGATPKPNLANLDAYLSVGVAIDHDTIEIGMSGDYHGYYRDALTAIHRQRPLAPDGRLWTQDAIDAADAPPAQIKARDAA